MRPSQWILGTLPLLALLGCSNFLDPDDYAALPALEELDFTTVDPSAPFLLWELREGMQGGTHRVIARGGSVSPTTIPANVLADFNAAQASSGFDPGCLPGDCYKYFVSLDGTTIRIWDSIEEVREFIGAVTNPVEAALVAKSNGFYWVPPKETAAIREVAGGFELVVLALVEYCEPVRYDRFLVHVSTSGALMVRKREVWERQSGCI